jgi:ABC-type Fe3+/spermidine/putrescine transport system ATPase subunit
MGQPAVAGEARSNAPDGLAQPPVFVARGLSKVYQTGEVEVVALRDVSLDIARGEFVVLLGASGSGKSTLLNILGGLDVPTTGEVRFGDHELTGAGEADLTRYRREHVGFVFQFYNLIPSLTVRDTLPGVSDPIVGQLIGIDPRRPPRMSRLTLRSGRAADDTTWPGRELADGALPAWVSESFAEARGLEPGARLRALINGRQRTLVMAGVALSPEYIFAGLWGMPDQRGFGVFWVDHEALAAAFDMVGAFNRVAAKLAPQADERAVIDALALRLAPCGGRQPTARTDPTSHAMLDNEIK